MVKATSGTNVHCETEYSPLNKVVVAKPSYMKITEIINETQKHYKNHNINVDKALQQHDDLIRVLEDQGVEVFQIPSQPDLYEQVFTRDIGFTIGGRLFISKMNENVRHKEIEVFQEWAMGQAIPFEESFPGSIEGGDVIVDEETVWMGESNRTSFEAIKALDKRLPGHHVIPLPLRKDILHLDCVFNILDESTAVLYPPAFNRSGLKILSSRYNLIEVSDRERFNMGPNVLSIGNRKIISLPQNQQLNAHLHKMGFQVITIDFSEIIKSGGSFRCCTLPLKRS